MFCKCGKRLVRKGIENGCYVLACPNTKCERVYQIPINPQLDYPGDRIISGWKPPAEPLNAFDNPTRPIPVRKIYLCTDCRHSIEKEQALRTFEQEERSLCVICETKEHTTIRSH